MTGYSDSTHEGPDAGYTACGPPWPNRCTFVQQESSPIALWKAFPADTGDVAPQYLVPPPCCAWNAAITSMVSPGPETVRLNNDALRAIGRR